MSIGFGDMGVRNDLKEHFLGSKTLGSCWEAKPLKFGHEG